MKYYNDRNGKYEDLILNDDDLSVKARVEKIYNDKPTDNVNKLSNRVQDYYYNEVGISNNRLWYIVIELQCIRGYRATPKIKYCRYCNATFEMLTHPLAVCHRKSDLTPFLQPLIWHRCIA